MRIRGVGLAAVCAAVAMLGAACAGSQGGEADTAATVEGTVVVPSTFATPTPTASKYAQPGPYPVGVTELTSGTTPITVFYPALEGSEDGHLRASYDLRDWMPPGEAAKVQGLPAYTMDAFADLPPAGPDSGPFPLILFSHGFAGYRLQSTFLTTHLASWGFVVAAVEHPYRNLTAVFGSLGAFSDTLGTDESPDVAQLLGAIDVVKAASDAPTGTLSGLAVDTEHIGAVGHSLGGFAVFAAARDPRVDTYVALAFPVGGTFVEPSTPTTIGGPIPPSKPSLLIAGSSDKIAPLPRVDAAYASLPEPKRLAIIDNMTHLGFTDLCELTESGTPDVLATAMHAGVAVPPIVAAVFSDGCDPKYAAPHAVWPALDELITADLRATLGIDPTALDFDENAVNEAFPDLHVDWIVGPH